MRFEILEPRVVLAGHSVDDFHYSSEVVSVEERQGINEGDYDFSDTNTWFKIQRYQSLVAHEDGYLVAERKRTDTDLHTMLVARVRGDRGAEDFGFDGMYTRPDHHYRISFDIRHPASEESWLRDHSFGLVMQMWGPREPGESARNPPMSIQTKTVNGEPFWTVRGYGDSRPITQTGEFEYEYQVDIPFTGIGEWHTWDIEYVPNSFNNGMVRAWLDGQLVGEWLDVSTSYNSILADEPSGPLNPAFGLYSSLAENGMEVHLDNIKVNGDGRYQVSIAGTVGGTAVPGGNTVVATNLSSGKAYEVKTSNGGVYSFSVPPGQYSLTAQDEQGGRSKKIDLVDVRTTTQVVNVEFVPVAPEPDGVSNVPETPTEDPPAETPTNPPDEAPTESPADPPAEEPAEVNKPKADPKPSVPPPPVVEPEPEPEPAIRSTVLSGDVNGDGTSEVVHVLDDGTLLVSETASVQRSVATRQWGTFPANMTWSEANLADFTGDGLNDVVAKANDGVWWVAESTGDGFDVRSWSERLGASWLDVSVGDFNGDGKADIAGRPVGRRRGGRMPGRWWVSFSEGDHFRSQYFGNWTDPADWVDVRTGDFDGDGRDDLVSRNSQDGTLRVFHATDEGFVGVDWGIWSTEDEWLDVDVGDFNGDGLADVIGRSSSTGLWWLSQSDGETFQTGTWSKWAVDDEWDNVTAVDVNGDGRTDIVGQVSVDQSWWLTESSDKPPSTRRPAHENAPWDSVIKEDIDWIEVIVDDFDGDGDAEPLGVDANLGFAILE